MRLWSIHPKYLDAKGLVALWREALLAREVLRGEIKRYGNHPQLRRFRDHPLPEKAIENYLIEIRKEAEKRGYNFNKRKTGRGCQIEKIPVTSGQLRYEFNWLCSKLQKRDAPRYRELTSVREIEPNPIFEVTEGGIEEWEKVNPDAAVKIPETLLQR